MLVLLRTESFFPVPSCKEHWGLYCEVRCSTSSPLHVLCCTVLPMGPVKPLIRSSSARNVLLPNFILRVLAVAQVSAWAFGFHAPLFDMARVQQTPATWGTGTKVRAVHDVGLVCCAGDGLAQSRFGHARLALISMEWVGWGDVGFRG